MAVASPTAQTGEPSKGFELLSSLKTAFALVRRRASKELGSGAAQSSGSTSNSGTEIRRSRAWKRAQASHLRPVRGAEREDASLVSEQPPDGFRGFREKLDRELVRGITIAAVEHCAVFDQVFAVFAEQLSTHPQIAILEHTKGTTATTIAAEAACESSFGHYAIKADLVVDRGENALRPCIVGSAFHSDHSLPGGW